MFLLHKFNYLMKLTNLSVFLSLLITVILKFFADNSNI